MEKWFTSCCLLLGACRGVTAEPTGGTTPVGHPSAPPAATGGAAPIVAAPAPLADSAATAPEPDPSAPQRSHFPPPPFEPPHARTAHPGDGEWTSWSSSRHGNAESEALLARTTVHPHPVSRFATITVVAIDLTRLRLVWVPGTDDPQPAKTNMAWTPGLIDPKHVASTLAVFNGGFQAHHGWWGMMREGHQLVKPRKDGCTIALYGNGTVRVGSWPSLEGSDMIAFRQTPPCLLRDGEESSLLKGKTPRIFGGTQADRKTRRRSAVGIDSTGRILFYGLGEEAEPRELAAGMRAAGADDVAQLDINWNWTRFLLVGEAEEAGKWRIVDTLLANMNHGKTEYVHRPTQRDFFYLHTEP